MFLDFVWAFFVDTTSQLGGGVGAGLCFSMCLHLFAYPPEPLLCHTYRETNDATRFLTQNWFRMIFRCLDL